eukprot:s456_g3.t1
MPAIRKRCASEWAVKLYEASLLDAAFEALKAGASGRKTVTDVQMFREHGCYLSLKFSKAVTFSAAHDWVKQRVPAGKKRKRAKQKETVMKIWSLQEPQSRDVEASSPQVPAPASHKEQWHVQQMLLLHCQPDRLQGGFQWKQLGFLGDGAFGTVSLGQLPCGRKVAVKSLSFGVMKCKKDLAAVIAEIDLLGKTTSCPYVVDLLGVNRSQAGHSELIFECGLSLEKCIHKGRCAVLKDALLMATHLCRGLKFLHGIGCLHADLKPANCLWFEDDQVCKLADLGSARFLWEKAAAGKMVTIAYRSIELLLGSTCLTSALDMWSFGCTLAEMLLGKPLFSQEGTWSEVAPSLQQSFFDSELSRCSDFH